MFLKNGVVLRFMHGMFSVENNGDHMRISSILHEKMRRIFRLNRHIYARISKLLFDEPKKGKKW